jgi:hypothetical protein
MERSMENNYASLLIKIDEFIRKYYFNKLIRGLIYVSGIAVLFFTFLALVEYYAHMSVLVRTVFFFAYLAVNLFLLVRLIIIPLFNIYKLGKVISYEQASIIIGNHFRDIKDKLINTLQLNQQLKINTNEAALIEASINQRIKELRPVPFKAAVDLSENKQYAKFAIIPLLLFSAIYLINPRMIQDGSKRMLAYNAHFEREAPFTFDIRNESLKVPSNEDFVLDVEIKGQEFPAEVYIEIGSSRFKLNKEQKNLHSYTFRNLLNDVEFRLFADGFYSKLYIIDVLPNPELTNFTVSLEYPKYTGKKNELIKNSGDLIIPEGTTVKWNFDTQNADKAEIQFADTLLGLDKTSKGLFSIERRFFANNEYKVNLSNTHLSNKSFVNYTIQVVNDQYPEIEVDEKSDSTAANNRFFSGIIRDDYGFRNLSFIYTIVRDGKEVKKQASDIPINKSFMQSRFFHAFNPREIETMPGDEITYYFEVFDNDQINGSKASRSQKKIIKVPTKDELIAKKEENNEQVKSNMKQSVMEAQKLQSELDELNKRLLEKKDINWQDKKKLQDLIEKQKKLQKDIEQIKQQNKKSNERFEEVKPQNESLIEKQRELERLIDQLMNEEMKQKLEEMQKMMDQLDKNKLRDIIEDMKKDSRDMEKELDRSLELFKQLEVEQKLEQAIEKLDELAEKQEKLSEESKEKGADSKDLKDKQDQLNKEFDKLKEDLKDLKEKNDALENPMNMEDMSGDQKEISDDMQKSSDDLQQGKPGKASKSQKSASDKMKDMNQKMKDMQQAMEQDSMEEDIAAMRQLLENLVQLSFEQEDVMKQFQRTQANNPYYIELTKRQKKIKDDAKMVEDSLFALSKRVVQIESFVNKEMAAVNMNMAKAIAHLAERQTPQAASRQQFVMTAINNLALLLSEVNEQMMQQMAAQMQQQKEGQGSCNKPGSNKKPGKSGMSMATMRQLQQQINDQMKKMQEGMQQMKNGQKPGKEMSEGLARMAAQQEALRNELQKMINEMNKDGKNGNSGNLQKLADQMDKNTTDIVNKNLTSETLRRQQEIMTRLLEAERAERERELDEKRESNENKVDIRRNLQDFPEYNRQMQREAELLKTLPPALKPYYKNLVKEYFNSFE